VETSELVHAQIAQLSERTLLIAVSQSGQSVEALRLLERLPTSCHLVGVTNEQRSPLAQRARTAITMLAGEETTVSCKTYLATVTALLWLIRVLRDGNSSEVGEELAATADVTAEYLSQWRDHTEALARLLEPIEHLFILGRGPSLAAAGTGALIIKEAARFQAEAMSSATFRHGPMELVSDDTAVFILEGSSGVAELNQKLHHDLQGLSAVVHLLDRKTALPALRLPTVSDSMLPLVEVLPLQMMSLGLAALVGHEAGRFLRATKLTTVE
jgi:glucosamine--fructose-6-phosphate aminotransferase (isomerizing)